MLCTATLHIHTILIPTYYPTDSIQVLAYEYIVTENKNNTDII